MVGTCQMSQGELLKSNCIDAKGIRKPLSTMVIRYSTSEIASNTAPFLATYTSFPHFPFSTKPLMG